MKNYKKILILIAIIFLIISIFFIIQTYSKYLSSATGETSVSIAKWNIKVNNLSVTTNTDISASIVPVFPGNSNIANNIIAPTAEGYFDLVLDFQDTDVSFNYTISSSVAEDSPVKDFVIVGYSIDNGERIDITDTQDNLVSEDILLTDNITTRTVRIFVKWIDDDSQTMDNADDTIATTSDNPAKFNVNLSFKQII
mgnify:FL=1